MDTGAIVAISMNALTVVGAVLYRAFAFGKKAREAQEKVELLDVLRQRVLALEAKKDFGPEVARAAADAETDRQAVNQELQQIWERLNDGSQVLTEVRARLRTWGALEERMAQVLQELAAKGARIDGLEKLVERLQTQVYDLNHDVGAATGKKRV